MHANLRGRAESIRRLHIAPAIGRAVRRTYANRAASPRAFMWAIASIEIIGLTPEAVGKAEPSHTMRSRTSHVWPVGSHAEVAGEPPMRAEAMMWKEPSTHWPGP